jgi:hypothetical protein
VIVERRRQLVVALYPRGIIVYGKASEWSTNYRSWYDMASEGGGRATQGREGYSTTGKERQTSMDTLRARTPEIRQRQSGRFFKEDTHGS